MIVTFIRICLNRLRVNLDWINIYKMSNKILKSENR